MSTKKIKRVLPCDPMWPELSALIAAYADARVADSWKGGGDPNDIEIYEARLKLAEVELEAHIRTMRRKYE